YREGGFMDTFQPTDPAYRVQDVLTAAAYLKNRRDLTGAVTLFGLEQGGMWTMLAGAVDSGIKRVIAAATQFKKNVEQARVYPFSVPCLRSIGHPATADGLTALRRLQIFNTGSSSDAANMLQVCVSVKASCFNVTADALLPEAIAALVR